MVTSAVKYEPGGSTQQANENYGCGHDPAENWLGRTNNTLIQGFESDSPNERASATRDNNVLTVAAPVTNHVTARAVNGQAVALDHDGSCAVAVKLLAEKLPVKWIVAGLPMGAAGQENRLPYQPRKGM